MLCPYAPMVRVLLDETGCVRRTSVTQTLIARTGLAGFIESLYHRHYTILYSIYDRSVWGLGASLYSYVRSMCPRSIFFHLCALIADCKPSRPGTATFSFWQEYLPAAGSLSISLHGISGSPHDAAHVCARGYRRVLSWRARCYLRGGGGGKRR